MYVYLDVVKGGMTYDLQVFGVAGKWTLQKVATVNFRMSKPAPAPSANHKVSSNRFVNDPTKLFFLHAQTTRAVCLVCIDVFFCHLLFSWRSGMEEVNCP